MFDCQCLNPYDRLCRRLQKAVSALGTGRRCTARDPAAVPHRPRARRDEPRTSAPRAARAVRGLSEEFGEERRRVSPQHPAQVAPGLPESLSHQAVSARSFPGGSLSVVSTKSKKNPTDFLQPDECLVEGRKTLLVLVHILPDLSLLIYFGSSLELSVSVSHPASDSSCNASESFNLIIIFSKVKPFWETLKMEITV